MPQAIWVVLIPALSAAFVALVTLVRQELKDRRKTKTTQTEDQLSENDRLLHQYRRLIDVYKTDAEDARAGEKREREAHRLTEQDRDEWRRRALVAEEKVDKWHLGREGL